MTESTTYSNIAGTLLRKLEALAIDLKCPTALSKFLPSAFSFLVGKNTRVLLVDSGVRGQLAFVARSLFNDENVGVQSHYEFNAATDIFVESVEKFSDKEIPIVADAALLIVDAAQAWTRPQDLFFKNAVEKKIPVCIVLVGLGNVDAGEQNDVLEYVESRTKSCGNTLLLTADDSDGMKQDSLCGEMLRDFLSAALASENVLELRKSTAKSIFSYALEVLRPQMEKLSDLESKEQKIKADAIFDVKTQQDSLEISWQKIEREGINYRRRAENELRVFFEKAKKTVGDDLAFSMSNSPSVNEWWGSCFEYKLRKQLEALEEKAVGKLKELIRKDLASLAQSVSRKFGVSVELSGEFDQIELSLPGVGDSAYGISKNQQIVVRIGSLLLGTCLATTGIGVLAIGVPNIITEAGMRIFEKQSKEEAKPQVLYVTEKAISVLSESIVPEVKSVYERMLSELEKAHSEWIKSASEKVEKMKATPANAELSALREKCESAFNEITGLVKNI